MQILIPEVGVGHFKKLIMLMVVVCGPYVRYKGLLNCGDRVSSGT